MRDFLLLRLEGAAAAMEDGNMPVMGIPQLLREAAEEVEVLTKACARAHSVLSQIRDRAPLDIQEMCIRVVGRRTYAEDR